MTSAKKVTNNTDGSLCNAYEISGISYDACYDPHDPEGSAEFLRAAEAGTKVLLALEEKPKLGDLIFFVDCERYRNDGVCIWDGEKIIDLEYDHDEYGHLPSKFRVIELTIGENIFSANFPIGYWHDPLRKNGEYSIVHNHIVWFDHINRQKELYSNVTYSDTLTPGKFQMYTYFMYSGKRYNIVYAYYIHNDDINTVKNTLSFNNLSDETKSNGVCSRRSRIDEYNDLINTGLSNEQALIKMGYNPKRIDEETDKLSDEIYEKVLISFRKLLSSKEMFPFSAVSPVTGEYKEDTLWLSYDDEE